MDGAIMILKIALKNEKLRVFKLEDRKTDNIYALNDNNLKLIQIFKIN